MQSPSTEYLKNRSPAWIAWTCPRHQIRRDHATCRTSPFHTVPVVSYFISSSISHMQSNIDAERGFKARFGGGWATHSIFGKARAMMFLLEVKWNKTKSGTCYSISPSFSLWHIHPWFQCAQSPRWTSSPTPCCCSRRPGRWRISSTRTWCWNRGKGRKVLC